MQRPKPATKSFRTTKIAMQRLRSIVTTLLNFTGIWRRGRYGEIFVSCYFRPRTKTKTDLDLGGDSEPTFPGIRPASVVAQNPQYPQRSIQGLMGYRPQLNGSHRVEPIRQHAQSPPEFPYRFAQEQRQPQNYGAFPTPSPQSQYARPNHLPPTGPRAELSQPGPVPVKKWQRSPPKPEISQFRTVSGPRPIVVAQMPKQEPLAVKANAQQHIPTGNDDSGIAAPQFIGTLKQITSFENFTFVIEH